MTETYIQEIMEHLPTAISLAEIARIYGIACLVMLPATLAIMLSIYKKHPDIAKKIDKVADRIVDGKGTKQTPKDDAKDGKTEATVQEEKNDEQDYGITDLSLQVGDRYRCYLSKKNMDDIRGSDYTWDTDNRFIGQIGEESGIFTAKKAGRSYIECGAEHIQIYHVTIRPNDTGWFAYGAVADILTGSMMADVKVRMASCKILSNDAAAEAITYEVPEGTLTYQGDGKGRLRRILYILNKNVDMEHLERAILEYMEPLKVDTKQTGCLYWYRKKSIEDRYLESVDFAAFVAERKDGKRYFGIGSFYRQGADENEFRSNADMFRRTFRDLLAQEDIPRAIGIDLDENEKEGQQHTATKKNEASPAEPGKQTTAQPTMDDLPDIDTQGDDSASDDSPEDYGRDWQDGPDVPSGDDADLFPDYDEQ